jgi:hypothetical protein
LWPPPEPMRCPQEPRTAALMQQQLSSWLYLH